MNRPRVLLIPPAVSHKRFRSVLRVDDATKQVLADRFVVREIGTPLGRPAPFLEEFSRIKAEIDVVFDMSGVPMTGPEAPEIPVVMWALGNLPHGASLLSSRRRQLKSSDSLLVNSSADLAILHNTIGPSGLHGVVVPFGVDTDRFGPGDGARRRNGRARFGLPRDSPVLCYAGRLNVQKNVHSLLFLVAALRSEDVHLAIAGTPDRTKLGAFGLTNEGYGDHLNRIIDDLDLASRVHFVGNLDDRSLAELYQASDLFVSLSTHADENFGFAPVEAMACGLPTVVSDWGGYRDSVVDGVTGTRLPTYVTRNGPRASWRSGVDAVRSLLRDRQRLGEMSTAASTRVAEFYSRSCFADNLERAVCDAASRGGEGADSVGAGFRFHPLAARLFQRNALLHMSYERTGGTFDPRITPDVYDSYRFFIGPYASRDVCDQAATDDDRPALLLEVAVRGDRLVSRDLSWKGEYELGETRARLFAALDGTRSIGELAKQDRGSGVEELCHEVTRLVRQGVVELGRDWL